MERYCSTGQSPQRAVAPKEEEEEEEEEEEVEYTFAYSEFCLKWTGIATCNSPYTEYLQNTHIKIRT
jgi:hypothetical protein